MARPTSISDAQILEAARQQFIAHGFQVSSAEIAQRAGVSEGTIFKRFPTKEALFYAALGLPEEPDWVSEWSNLVGCDDPRSVLTRMLRDLLTVLAEIVPRYMALKARGFRSELRAGDLRERPFLRYRRALAGFLEAETALGRVRAPDPVIWAEMLVGATFVATLQATALGQTMSQDDVAAYVDHLVDAIWAGIGP